MIANIVDHENLECNEAVRKIKDAYALARNAPILDMNAEEGASCVRVGVDKLKNGRKSLLFLQFHSIVIYCCLWVETKGITQVHQIFSGKS